MWRKGKKERKSSEWLRERERASEWAPVSCDFQTVRRAPVNIIWSFSGLLEGQSSLHLHPGSFTFEKLLQDQEPFQKRTSEIQILDLGCFWSDTSASSFPLGTGETPVPVLGFCVNSMLEGQSPVSLLVNWCQSGCSEFIRGRNSSMGKKVEVRWRRRVPLFTPTLMARVRSSLSFHTGFGQNSLHHVDLWAHHLNRSFFTVSCSFFNFSTSAYFISRFSVHMTTIKQLFFASQTNS